MRIALISALALGAILTAGSVSADVLHFTATLNGASETPPNSSPGTGAATVDLDTTAKTVTWTVTYSGLSGPATAAHFHGPAPAGRAAGVEIPITGSLVSPITGSASVNADQADDLQQGLWYVNIHTAAKPNGEIRGQVLAPN